MIYYFRDVLIAISAIIMLTLFYMLASCEFVHAKKRINYELSNKGRQTWDTIKRTTKQTQVLVNLPHKTYKLAKELRFDTPRVEISD